MGEMYGVAEGNLLSKYETMTTLIRNSAIVTLSMPVPVATEVPVTA